MNTASHVPRVAVQLNWDDQSGMITVTPSDQDRFSMRIDVAIGHLRAAQKSERTKKQLDFLFKQLAVWLNGRSDIKSAYVTVRDGDLAFVVVHDSGKYDETFEDDLSDLDVQLAKDVDLADLQINVFSLPLVSDEALDSFLHSEIQFKLQHGSN